MNALTEDRKVLHERIQYLKSMVLRLTSAMLASGLTNEQVEQRVEVYRSMIRRAQLVIALHPTKAQMVLEVFTDFMTVETVGYEDEAVRRQQTVER